MVKPLPANRRIKDLVLWLRAERITWQSLIIGDVTIDGGQDMKLIESLPPGKPAAPRPSIHERYGGALLEPQTTPAETFSPVVEDEE